MNALSLFSNVGFGEFYLKDCGVNVLIANELMSDRCDLYKKFHPGVSCVCGDISTPEIRNEVINSCRNKNIDLVIATPPCQGMSGANALKKPDDPRNTLITHALDVFKSINAKYMLIENVPQMPKTFIFEKSTDSVVKISDFINNNIPQGMEANFSVLDAKYFGTPQSRKRSICLISKNGEWTHPKPSTKTQTLRDAIGHLPSLKNDEHSNIPWHFCPRHNKNHIKWMSSTPEGDTAFNNVIDYPQKDGRKIKGFMSTYKKMYWDKPAPTVTMTNGSISSQNNVHPSDPRVLSIRELLCVCGLPEDCLDKFAHKLTNGLYKYDYKSNFIRKVIGEIFLPKLSSSIIKNITNK